MARYLSTLARVFSGDFTDASENERASAVVDLVGVCSAAAGAAALDVLPFTDLPLVHGIQLAMVEGIGRIRGSAFDQRAAFALFKALRMGFFTRQFLGAAARLVPGFGTLASVSVAYATTLALGETSDYYFRTGRSASGEALRVMFASTYRRARGQPSMAAPWLRHGSV